MQTSLDASAALTVSCAHISNLLTAVTCLAASSGDVILKRLRAFSLYHHGPYGRLLQRVDFSPTCSPLAHPSFSDFLRISFQVCLHLQEKPLSINIVFLRELCIFSSPLIHLFESSDPFVHFVLQRLFFFFSTGSASHISHHAWSYFPHG